MGYETFKKELLQAVKDVYKRQGTDPSGEGTGFI